MQQLSNYTKSSALPTGSDHTAKSFLCGQRVSYFMTCESVASSISSWVCKHPVRELFSVLLHVSLFHLSLEQTAQLPSRHTTPCLSLSPCHTNTVVLKLQLFSPQAPSILQKMSNGTWKQSMTTQQHFVQCSTKDVVFFLCQCVLDQ